MAAPRILIVDHDSKHAEHCQAFLSPEGFDVVHAASVIEARRHVALGVDAAIIDGISSDHGIGDLMKRLQIQDVPIFGMTDIYLGETNRTIALVSDKFAEYWSKPLSPDKVIPWIDRMINGRLPEETADIGAITQKPQENEQRSAFTFSREVEALSASAPKRDVRRRDLSKETYANIQSIPNPGTFEEFNFSEVLGGMNTKQATGSLMLRNGKIKKLIYLKQGIPVGAKSNLERDRLGQMMRAHRLISAKDLKASRKAMQREGVLQGEALIAIGVLKRKNLQEILDIQLRVKLEDIFRWNEGVFSFRKTNIPSNYHTAKDVTTLQLVWDAARYLISPKQIKSLVSQSYNRRLIWYRTLEQTQIDAMQLNPSALMLLDHVSQGREFDTLEATIDDPTCVRQLLFALLSTNYIGFE